jgi:uncharacterized membrane protein
MTTSESAGPPPETPHPHPDLAARLDDFAQRLAALESELRELRGLVQTRAPVAESPILRTPVPPPPPAAAATPPRPQPPVQPPPPAPQPTRSTLPPVTTPPAPPPPPAAPRFWEREISFDDLFGAKALAWAGGFVTLLGIVFFFVLAVNRGWIGPAARVSLGAVASLLVFGAGLWARRAYGNVYSALAAAGAGIAGGYATLLAATALYDLVPRPVALLLAAGIAAVGVATALAWSSELIAGLGLIGATLAPAAIALQDAEPSSIGTGFAALMFAGTATVAVSRRWQALLGIGVVASLPQVAALVAHGGVIDWDVVVVTAACWLFYLGSAIALQLRLETRALASLPTMLVLVGGVLAGLSSVDLFAGNDEGWALLAVAAVHAAAAAVLFPRVRDRDLSAFLGAVALAVAAVGVAIPLSGPALTMAWAAEAAVLAWLARRAGELRYQIAALAYLLAAFVHAVFWEAPLDQLYTAMEHPASGVAAIVAVALCAGVFAYYARPWDSDEHFGGVFVLVAPILEAFRGSQPVWRSIAGWASALAALYAASLGVLESSQWLESAFAAIGDGGPPPDPDKDVRNAFERGHVVVTALWATVSLAVIAAGHRRPSRQLVIGGLSWLAAVLLQVVLFDTSLTVEPRRACFLLLAAAAAALGLLGRSIDEPWCHVAALTYLAPLLVYALVEAPPDQLYSASHTPASNPELVSVLAFGLAAAIVGYCLRLGGDAPGLRVFFGANQRIWRSIAGWGAALAALYAGSLGLLAVAQEFRDDGIRPPFEWGHVGVTGLWGLAALAVLGLGHLRSSLELRLGGLAWLGAVLLQAVLFDVSLDSDPRGWAFLVAAAALLAGALADRVRLPEAPALAIVVGFVLASIGLGVAGLLELTSGDWEGYALLGLAALYCAISVVVWGDRDLGTVLWAPAFVVAGWAAAILLSDTWLVLAWAVAAAALAALADRIQEGRLQLAAFAFLVLALGHTLVLEAPPADLFEANPHPENGVPALLFVLAAAFVFGRFSRDEPDPLPEQPTYYEEWAHYLRAHQPLWRKASFVTTALLTVYAGSLSILGVAEALGGAGVATNFQRGHSGVSAFWGVIGLVALYVGLTRGLRWLRLAGFGLFGLALAKLFLYDLAFLSSITRALSFLAVGAVLLLAGFFVQKLGTQRDATS